MSIDKKVEQNTSMLLEVDSTTKLEQVQQKVSELGCSFDNDYEAVPMKLEGKSSMLYRIFVPENKENVYDSLRKLNFVYAVWSDSKVSGFENVNLGGK